MSEAIRCKDVLFKRLNEQVPHHLSIDDIYIIGIGTDRSTGDSLGPLVGSYLSEKYKNVIGTIDEPCHATNLIEKRKSVPDGKYIIAVDACLGEEDSVGTYKIVKGITAGAGVGRTDLGVTGDIGVTGIVNVGGFMEYFVLLSTRLSIVMGMAKDIVYAIDGVLMERNMKCSRYEVAAALNG